MTKWFVGFVEEFREEFRRFPEEVRKELAATLNVLREFGPETGRPWVDTLNGSKHANMKELRFDADDGVWRAAFAFDTERQAVVLVAGDKSGLSSDKGFYKELIKIADRRFDAHLAELKKAKEAREKEQKAKEKVNKNTKSKKSKGKSKSKK